MTPRAYKLALVLLLALGAMWFGLRYFKGAPSTVSYGADALQQADVYSSSNCPAAGCDVLVLVHGGGWSGGDKIDLYNSRVAGTLSRDGLVVVAPNHRLAPTFKHPAQVSDVAAAIAWTHQNIKAYGGNPERIFLLGHSSGAHLVSLVATNPYYLAQYNMKPENLRGVISLDTASLDLERRIRVWGEDDDMRTNTFPLGSERSASPHWNVKPGFSYPPFLFIAASDAAEPIKQAGAMAAQLTNVGGKAETAVMPYDGSENSHLEILYDLASTSNPVTQRVLGYIRAN